VVVLVLVVGGSGGVVAWWVFSAWVRGRVGTRWKLGARVRGGH